MSTKPKLRVGLIGTGFMGKTHVFGFATSAKVFDLPFEIELHTVADVTEAAALQAAADFGFARATSDWRGIIRHPEIDVVDITAPNALHEEMALAANRRWQARLLRKASGFAERSGAPHGGGRRGRRDTNTGRIQLSMQPHGGLRTRDDPIRRTR
jgi:Oxidoreductase family, NAD-binding Rossmann fold